MARAPLLSLSLSRAPYACTYLSFLALLCSRSLSHYILSVSVLLPEHRRYVLYGVGNARRKTLATSPWLTRSLFCLFFSLLRRRRRRARRCTTPRDAALLFFSFFPAHSPTACLLSISNTERSHVHEEHTGHGHAHARESGRHDHGVCTERNHTPTEPRFRRMSRAHRVQLSKKKKEKEKDSMLSLRFQITTLFARNDPFRSRATRYSVLFPSMRYAFSCQKPLAKRTDVSHRRSILL